MLYKTCFLFFVIDVLNAVAVFCFRLRCTRSSFHYVLCGSIFIFVTLSIASVSDTEVNIFCTVRLVRCMLVVYFLFLEIVEILEPSLCDTVDKLRFFRTFACYIPEAFLGVFYFYLLLPLQISYRTFIN